MKSIQRSSSLASNAATLAPLAWEAGLYQLVRSYKPSTCLVHEEKGEEIVALVILKFAAFSHTTPLKAVAVGPIVWLYLRNTLSILRSNA